MVDSYIDNSGAGNVRGIFKRQLYGDDERLRQIEKQKILKM
jgi:hypothetical protein